MVLLSRKPIQSILRLKNLPSIEIIDQNSAGRPPVHSYTPFRLLTNTPFPHPCVRPLRIPSIRHNHVQNLRIQEMVHDVHSLRHHRREFAQPLRPIDLALRERRIEGIVRSFPEVGELVEEVGDFGLICAIVKESNEARVGGDEFAESGPGVEGPFLGISVRGVCVRCDPAFLERFAEVGGVEVVAVCEEDSNDFLGMVVEPLLDYLEVVFQ